MHPCEDEGCPHQGSPHTCRSPEPVPDNVWEALQRLIENGASLGPASEADALLVAEYRDRFFHPGNLRADGELRLTLAHLIMYGNEFLDADDIEDEEDRATVQQRFIDYLGNLTVDTDTIATEAQDLYNEIDWSGMAPAQAKQLGDFLCRLIPVGERITVGERYYYEYQRGGHHTGRCIVKSCTATHVAFKPDYAKETTRRHEHVTLTPAETHT